MLPRAKSVQVFKSGEADLEARIITAISQVGPRNVAAISRATGAHPETVRYQIKKRLGKLGFRFHADVDYSLLGLRQYWGTFRFDPGYRGDASGIFPMLNKVGYLTYYAKIVPQGHYVARFALPDSDVSELRDVLEVMQKDCGLKEFSFEEALASSHRPMNPRFFNFRSGSWEVEWDKVQEEEAVPLQKERAVPVEEADYTDMLIVKELQKDALSHVAGMARKLGISEKTLEYHYRTHVVHKRLIRGYIVRWTRDVDKSITHSVATTRLTFKGLSSQELTRLQAAVSKVPFLWAEELLRDGTYIATFYIPLTELIAVFSYLDAALPDLDSRVEVGFTRSKEAELFTIPYEMYQDGVWTFDASRVRQGIRTVRQLV